ncbi:MAG: CHAT domain-containing protein [Verrucomicrobia bacterium]|nr:CHAT domain-containing protein [Verrucomicrobiota bacterium]
MRLVSSSRIEVGKLDHTEGALRSRRIIGRSWIFWASLSCWFSLSGAVVAEPNSSQLLDIGFTAPMLQYRLALRAACHSLNLALREEAGGYHGNDQDIVFAQSMVSMARLLDDSWLSLVGFHYWGNIELYQARYAAALEHSKDALRCLDPQLDIDHPAAIDFARLARIDFKNAAALQLDEIAIIFANWKKLDSAAEYAQAAIKVLKLETKGNDALLANALDLCADGLNQEGHWSQALHGYEEARDLLVTALAKLSPSDRISASDARLVLADTLRSIGYIKLEHPERPDRAEAQTNFRESLRLSEELSTPYEITEGKLALAIYFYEIGDLDEALSWATAAADLAEPSAAGNNTDTLWKALSIQGKCLVGLHQFERAETALRKAVGVIEGMRKEAGTDRRPDSTLYDSIAWFFAEKTGAYVALAQLLADENRTLEALTYTELSRQRALLDALAITASGRDTDRPFLQSDAAGIAGRLEKLIPDQRTAIVEYLLGTDHGYAFVLKRPSAILPVTVKTISLTYPKVSGSNSLPSPIQSLDATIDSFRNQIEKSYAAYPKEQAKALFTSLIAPVIPDIENEDTVVIVPAGKLWELPFQALPAIDRQKHRYLIEDLAISYTPSLAVLDHLRSVPLQPLSQDWMLAIGDPSIKQRNEKNSTDISGTGEIIRETVNLFGSKVVSSYTRDEATKARFLAEAPTKPVVFLATHAFLDGEDPLSSHFLLSPIPSQPGSERLTVSELLSIRLANRMALLFACDTERGPIVQGEGEIGLAWAFLHGGCLATLVSQWPVELQATAKLSGFFMQDLKQELDRSSETSFSTSELLRKAQLELLNSGEFSHPFYWAGIVLVGDPEWRMSEGK